MKQILITLLALLFVFQNLYAGTISIPNDQPTIQVGIVSSSNGDTILVSPGTYYENINFNGKNIVLGSLFLTTGDTSYISQTIIDGNQQGCVVVFESGEDSTATLTGFTIVNGYSYLDSLRGGGITCINSSNPKLTNLVVANNEVVGVEEYLTFDKYIYGGGGILCIGKSAPNLLNVKISNNIADYCAGGGIYCKDSSSIEIISSEIVDNFSRIGGGLAILNSSLNLNSVSIINNESVNGGGIYLDSSNTIIENSIIKQNYAKKRDSNGRGGGGGIFATNSTKILIQESDIIENIARWVSYNAIYPLSDGGGINLRLNSSATIEDCKINGNSSNADGGGIYVLESSIRIDNSEISKNSCEYFYGGGIYISSSYENIFLENVLISENYSLGGGGGMYYHPTQEIEVLKNVKFLNNVSDDIGGGLFINPNLMITETSGCSVLLNKAQKGGADIYIEFEDSNSTKEIYLDSITVSESEDYQIYPIQKINLHYNSFAFQTVESDLYVSPMGSNANRGTSKDEPLKSINFAMLVAKADSLNHRTIYLTSGTYSATTTGEEYPLFGRSYISITGRKADSTILDGENKIQLVNFSKCKNIMLENLTIQNGFGHFNVGGIFVNGEELILNNLIIKDNVSYASPGGIRVLGEGITLKNLIVQDNFSEYGIGGLEVAYSKQVNLVNLTVVNNNTNHPTHSGGITSHRVHNLSILNSIVRNNTPINVKLEPFVWNYIDTVLIGYSNIEGEITNNDSAFIHWLEGNIDTDPLFVGGNPFDYNLTDSSPCINAGTPFLVWEGDTLINLSPSEYIGEAPDMGALESDVLITVEKEETLPTEFKLEQNYPNPFNPTTTISYQIPSKSIVTLKVFNMLGQEVTTLVNEIKSAGKYTVAFDANNLASGMYIYRIQSGIFSETKKLLLLK